MTDLRTRSLRFLVAGALGLGLVGGAANAAHAFTPPADGGIDELVVVTEPTDPKRPEGPGDLTTPDEPDDDCHPLLATCDLTSNPGDDDGDGDDGGVEVDDSVVADPNFTG